MKAARYVSRGFLPPRPGDHHELRIFASPEVSRPAASGNLYLGLPAAAVQDAEGSDEEQTEGAGLGHRGSAAEAGCLATTATEGSAGRSAGEDDRRTGADSQAVEGLAHAAEFQRPASRNRHARRAVRRGDADRTIHVQRSVNDRQGVILLIPVERLDGGAVLLDRVRPGADDRTAEDRLSVARIADFQGCSGEIYLVTGRTATGIGQRADLLVDIVQVEGRARGHRDRGADWQQIAARATAAQIERPTGRISERARRSRPLPGPRIDQSKGAIVVAGVNGPVIRVAPGRRIVRRGPVVAGGGEGSAEVEGRPDRLAAVPVHETLGPQVVVIHPGNTAVTVVGARLAEEAHGDHPRPVDVVRSSRVKGQFRQLILVVVVNGQVALEPVIPEPRVRLELQGASGDDGLPGVAMVALHGQDGVAFLGQVTRSTHRLGVSAVRTLVKGHGAGVRQHHIALQALRVTVQRAAVHVHRSGVGARASQAQRAHPILSQRSCARVGPTQRRVEAVAVKRATTGRHFHRPIRSNARGGLKRAARELQFSSPTSRGAQRGVRTDRERPLIHYCSHGVSVDAREGQGVTTRLRQSTCTGDHSPIRGIG